jgi:Ribonuclease G/E
MSILVDPARLLTNLNILCAETGLNAVFTPKQIEELARASAPTDSLFLNGGDSQNNAFYFDSGSHCELNLLQDVDILYRDRALKYGKKITIEEFINNEPWGRIRDAGLLYSEFIRQIDKTLYQAIRDKASYNGRRITDLFTDLGIVTRFEILNPKPSQLDKVRKIRAAQVGLAQLSR